MPDAGAGDGDLATTVKSTVFDKDGGSDEYSGGLEILQPEISPAPTDHNSAAPI